MKLKKILMGAGIMVSIATPNVYANTVDNSTLIKNNIGTTIEVPKWKEGGSTVLPRDEYVKDINNNSFIVEDMETGKYMKILRTGGTNHMDVETLTQSDTDVMYSLWGKPGTKKGEFKWQTRPILVHYKGKSYVASMSGQPHAGWDNQGARVKTTNSRPGCGALGYNSDGSPIDYDPGDNLDSVKSNGIDGHMDIYFKQSGGHGSGGKESKAHNEALAKAETMVSNGYKTKLSENSGSDNVTTDTSNDNSSGNESETSTSTNTDDSNSTTVKDSVEKDDGFLTGTLVEGYNKLKDYEGKDYKIEEGNPPKGSYFFSNVGRLTGQCNGGGEGSTEGVSSDGKLFNDILKDKERDIVKQFQNLQKSNFSGSSVASDGSTLALIDTDLKGSFNFWEDDVNSLYTSTKASDIRFTIGDKSYYIYIPKGLDDEGNSVNQDIIKSTIQSVDLYKKAIMEGVKGGMSIISYNFYSMYPTKQVPLIDIVDITKMSKSFIRPLKQSTLVKYSLDYFIHPTLGKKKAEEMNINSSGWDDGLNRELVEYSKEDGKLGFKVSNEYKDFLTGTDPLRKGAYNLKDAQLKYTNGVRGYNLKNSGDKSVPANLVSTLFRVAVPNKFSKSLNSGNYELAKDGGYTLIDDIYIAITSGKVYKGSMENLSPSGDYNTYGLNEKGLALYNQIVDGKTVGVVVPLWMNEAVYNPYNDKLYYTGRPIHFRGDYEGKLGFDESNEELFSVIETGGGYRPSQIKKFAFDGNADYLVQDQHTNIGNAPDSFDINIVFESHTKGKPTENHSLEEEKKNETLDNNSNTNVRSRNINSDFEVEKEGNGHELTEDEYYGEKKKSIFTTYAKADPKDASKNWGYTISAEELNNYVKGKTYQGRKTRFEGMGEFILKASNVYKINPALLLSIMMHESGNGASNVIYKYNNPGGVMWLGIPMKFDTLEDGILYSACILSKYLGDGRETLEQIGKKYCTVGTKEWLTIIPKVYKGITGDTIDIKKNNKELFGSGLKLKTTKPSFKASEIKGVTIDNSSTQTKPNEEVNNAGSDNGIGADYIDKGVEPSKNEVFNGFTIIRNNVYLEDEQLISWLRSPYAKAMTNVEAEELEKQITGSVESGNADITYKEWERMESIKNELNGKRGYSSKVLFAIRLVTMTFGFVIIFYSILLVFAYYIDIIGNFFSFELLSLMTFGRLRGITHVEEKSTGGNMIEVTVANILVIASVGVFIGGLFLLGTPIMELIGKTYLKIKSFVSHI